MNDGETNWALSCPGSVTISSGWYVSWTIRGRPRVYSLDVPVNTMVYILPLISL